jgi:hypothetical protein
VGVLVFGEGFRFGTLGSILAAGAGAVAATGVIGLSRRTAVAAVGATPDAEPVTPAGPGLAAQAARS